MSLTLTKITETSSTITLGWTPPANVKGYVFTANGSPTVATANNKDGSPRKEVKFSKSSPGPPFQVAATCRAPEGSFSLEVGTYSDAPPPPPPPGDVVVVPASIDGTGQTDVTQALYNWINSQPSGKTLDMRGKTFRIDGQMYFNGKSGWTFDLRGTTIRETTIGDGHQSKFKFWNGGAIAFLCEGAKFLGAFSTPGVHDAANQWGHALDFLGVQGVSVDGGFAQNMCGDGVYIGASSQPCRNVNVRGFSSTGVGRNGVSVTGGEAVVIDGGTHESSGFICIDIEPNAQAGFTCRNIAVRNLVLGKYRLAAFGVIGHNVVDGVIFEDIRVTSSENKLRGGFGWEAFGINLTDRFKNITARRITADHPSGTGFGASRIDGLTIQDCVMPVTNMLRKRDVTGLVFSGNQPNTQTTF